MHLQSVVEGGNEHLFMYCFHCREIKFMNFPAFFDKYVLYCMCRGEGNILCGHGVNGTIIKFNVSVTVSIKMRVLNLGVNICHGLCCVPPQRSVAVSNGHVLVDTEEKLWNG